jgi:hypothetical protein
MVQELILCIDISVDGCIPGVEPTTNAGVVLWLGQEEGGIVGALLPTFHRGR